MQIPNLPTDNLYKFMALSGIVLVVLGTIVPAVFFVRFWPRLTELTVEINLLELENSFLREDIERETGENADALSPDEMTPGQREQFRQIARRLAQLDPAVDEVGSIIAGIIFASIYLIVVEAYGLFLMRRGFRLWSEKSQQYQDLIIRGEAERLRKEHADHGNA
jgi:nitrogen fixation-related uncharacterized protein